MSETNWKKQVNLLWLGQLVLMASMSMSVPFWPLFMKQLNTSGNMLSLWNAAVYSAPLVATIIFSPIWGKLSDKVGYKKMVLRAAAGLMITQALIAMVANPVAIVGFRLLQGVFSGFIAAAQSYAMSFTPTVSRGQVMGKLQSATAIGTLTGPFFGSLIADHLGFRHIFSWSAVFCLVMLVYLFFFLQEAPKKEEEKNIEVKSEEADIAIAQEKKISQRAITFYFLFLITGAQAARMMLIPFFALFVIEKLHGSNFDVGLLYSASGLTVFFAAPYWGRLLDKRLNQKKDMQVILIFITLAAAMLQFALEMVTHVYAVLILRLLWGLCLAGILPVLLTLLLHGSDQKSKGTVIGLGQSATKLGDLIGISLGAFIQGIFGFNTGISLIAGIYFMLAMVLLISKPIFSHNRFAQNVV